MRPSPSSENAGALVVQNKLLTKNEYKCFLISSHPRTHTHTKGFEL